MAICLRQSHQTSYHHHWITLKYPPRLDYATFAGPKARLEIVGTNFRFLHIFYNFGPIQANSLLFERYPRALHFK